MTKLSNKTIANRIARRNAEVDEIASQVRFEVVELRAKVRITGYGVRDNEKGWICEMFMFSDMGVAGAERAAHNYADRHNAA